jgi:hypothetical protein
MTRDPRSKAVIPAQGLENTWGKESLTKLREFECAVRSEGTMQPGQCQVTFLDASQAYDGLTIMTLPVNSAGAILPHASIIGKFHGTIAPTTPSGV